jgi:Ran GTPase-activating protein (RanGAP) involved in mRNA processing and transport
MSLIWSQGRPFSSSRSISITFRLNRPPSPTTYDNDEVKRTLDVFPSTAPIDLSYRKLGDDDLVMIVKPLIIGQRCSALDLCGNKLTCRGASILASCLSTHCTLHLLDLSYNHLSDVGVRILSDLLSDNRCTSLQKLILSKNGISNDGARDLADMLRTNCTITELHLSNNEIGNRGVEQLASVLAYRNTTLKVLMLSFNIFITDKSINALMKMIKFNQTLEYLCVNDCNLSSTGISKIHDEAHRKTHLNIEHCASRHNH